MVSGINLVSLILFVYLVILQFSTVQCLPHHHPHKIIIHGHEWTAPEETGWEEVLQEAELFRQNVLNNCETSRDCRLAMEELRRIFLKHPVSAKYYEDAVNNDVRPADTDSIFKWG